MLNVCNRHTNFIYLIRYKISIELSSITNWNAQYYMSVYNSGLLLSFSKSGFNEVWNTL